MPMITEINVIDPQIKGGRKIDAEAVAITNHRLHCFGTLIGRMIMASLEGDSNNTSATLTPSEVRDHWMMWQAVKQEWAFAKAHNDGPLTSVEENKAFLLPTGKEIQLCGNEKIKRVIIELKRLLQVTASVDSAGSQAHIGLTSQTPIEKQMSYCEDAMNHYWGKGVNEADTGVSIPEYRQLGVMIPDLDQDFATLQESSADRTETSYKDAADTASPTMNKT